MLNPPGSKKKITVGKSCFFSRRHFTTGHPGHHFFGKKGFVDIQKQKKKYEELEARIKRL